MTIRQALENLDQSKFNTVSQQKKIGWLSQLDLMAQELLIENFEDVADFLPSYNAQTDLDTLLVICAPYDEIYGYYLAAMVDFENQEFDRFNNAIAMYSAVWERYANHVLRTHTPKKSGDFHG